MGSVHDAHLDAEQLDRVIMVGGSTRIPLVQQMVEEHLGQAPTDGIQPDLCVALGAALQAGVLVGEAVNAILVDVTPHSLGVSAAVDTPIGIMPGFFSVIIPRNSVVPVSRAQVYATAADNQTAVEIEIFQGENAIAYENVPLGSLRVDDLPPRLAGGVQVEIHFDFDLSGILKVTATEKGKGQQGSLSVNNTTTHRLSSHELNQARADVEAMFELDETIEKSTDATDLEAPIDAELGELIDSAHKALETLSAEQAEELQDLLTQLDSEISTGSEARLTEVREELEDFLYYASTSDNA